VKVRILPAIDFQELNCRRVVGIPLAEQHPLDGRLYTLLQLFFWTSIKGIDLFFYLPDCEKKINLSSMGEHR